VFSALPAQRLQNGGVPPVSEARSWRPRRSTGARQECLRRAQGPHRHRREDRLPCGTACPEGQGSPGGGRNRARVGEDTDRQLERMKPKDRKYAATFTVLCEYVEHHVKEEENARASARSSSPPKSASHA